MCYSCGVPEPQRSNLDLTEAAQRIRGACGSILITTHAKPDGDAWGSVVALAATLNMLGCPSRAVLMGPIPMNLKGLGGSAFTELFDERKPVINPENPPALIVVVDTGAWAQLAPLREQLEPWTDRMLVLDHHLSGDVPAAHKCIDSGAAACCELVAALLTRLSEGTGKNPLSEPAIRDALFVGIASDTGWFRFSNTRPQTHELAALLIRHGADHAALHAQVQQTDPIEKLGLMTRALQSLDLLADGRCAVMVLRAGDFQETGAALEDTERLVDLPQTVARIDSVVLITETPGDDLDGDGPLTRVSFRSKPRPGALNVAKVAEQFGGGGHARAAGAKLNEPIDDVVRKVEAAMAAAYEG